MNDLAYDFEMYDLFCEMVANQEFEKQLHDFNIWCLKTSQESTSLINAICLHEHFKTHGVSQEAQMIFGGEGIFETVGSAVKKVIVWVYTKLKQLLSYISQVITITLIMPIINAIKKLIAKVRGLNKVALPYDLNKISSKLGCSIPLFREDDVVSETTVYNKTLEHWFGETDLSKVFAKLPDGQTITYAVSDVRDKLSVIENTVSLVSTWSCSIKKIINDMLPKFNYIINSNDTKALTKATCEFREKANRFFRFSRTIDDDDPKMPVYLTNILCGVSRCSADLFARLKPMLENIRRAVMRDSVAIHMSFLFDTGLRKHLSEHYKLRLHVDRLIITNSSPETWDTSVKSVTFGWCKPTFGQSGFKKYDGADADELWINWTFLSKWVLRWMFAWTNKGTVSPAYNLLLTIAHECKHLADGQAGRVFDTTKPYEKQDHEEDARKAESEFKPTEDELHWAMKIIAHVREEEKRQKVLKHALAADDLLK